VRTRDAGPLAPERILADRLRLRYMTRPAGLTGEVFPSGRPAKESLNRQES